MANNDKQVIDCKTDNFLNVRTLAFVVDQGGLVDPIQRVGASRLSFMQVIDGRLHMSVQIIEEDHEHE